MNEAEKLADSMDDEIAQAGRVTNHNGTLAAALLRGQAEQIKLLREALVKARQDINWMLNSRKFLDGFVFEYVDDALAATKEET